ncbi:IS200/IS605 family transposase [Desulfomarina sp.]
MRDLIREICKALDVEILEMNVQENHVHLVLSISPKLSVSSVVGFLEGKCAIKIFDKHLDLKRLYWADISGPKIIA